MDSRLKYSNWLLPLSILFVIIFLIMPRAPKFASDYRKGSAWAHETLVSQFDFPILKTEAQLMEERSAASRSVIPYFKYSEEIVNKSLRSAEALELDPEARLLVKSTLRSLFHKGIVSDEPVRPEKGETLNSELVYVQKDKRAAKVPAGEILGLGAAKAKLLAVVSSELGSSADSMLRNSGAYSLVVPNLFFDRQTTDLVFSESLNTISPTLGYVNAGQVIVSEGEIVTSEIAQILDSYRKEYNSSVSGAHTGFAFWLGSALLALFLVALLLAAVYFSFPSILDDRWRFAYMVCIYAIFSVSAIIMSRFAEAYIYLVPFTVSALYLQSFYKNRVIFPVYVFSLLPLLIFANNGAPLFIMFLSAGTVAIYVFRFFGKGWKQFIMALIIFAVLAVLYLAFSALDMLSGNILKDLALLFAGSLLTVAAYPAVLLFEKVFHLVSQTRLMELSDTTNPLLKELEKRAPGTFQHSLQVMNMAEAAAEAIGANTVLVRAGALYHDIGKASNPLCFIENESMLPEEERNRYHSVLTPCQSARDIIRHVENGVEVAKKYGLPDAIVDFIRTHHGTTRTGYFYSKFLSEGGDSSREAEFRYSGPAPTSKEQIILMLCDSIEAASRTLKDYSAASFDAFVENIVSSKMNEGQFDEAEITVKEITDIKSSLKKYLARMYHERIEYPDNNRQTIKK